MTIKVFLKKPSTMTLLVALIIYLSLFYVQNLRVNGSSIFLNLSTDKQVYDVGDFVTVTGNVTVDGSPVTDALVAIQVDSPYQTPYILRTVQTGEITQQSWEVNITEVIPCDSHGNPKTTFIRGELAYAKIAWKNYANEPKYIVVALYIEYSTKAPCKAYFPLKGTAQPDSQYLIAPFEISSDAPLGTAKIYANIYTNEPKEGGVPYCPEKMATFEISSSSGGSSSAQWIEENNPNSNFKVNFLLWRAKTGTYYVYASTFYLGTQVSNSLTFGVVLLGDIDNNGRVDMIDIGLVCDAFGSEPGDPNWNENADINVDERVDMIDIGLVCDNFGLSK